MVISIILIIPLCDQLSDKASFVARRVTIVKLCFCPKSRGNVVGTFEWYFCQSVGAVWVSTLIGDGDTRTSTATIKFVWTFYTEVSGTLEHCSYAHRATYLCLCFSRTRLIESCELEIPGPGPLITLSLYWTVIFLLINRESGHMSLLLTLDHLLSALHSPGQNNYF